MGVLWLYEQSSLAVSKVQYVGFSSFAVTHPSYNCSRFLSISDASHYPAITFPLRTFGDDYSCVKKFLDRYKSKPHLLQIHLTNETCRRKAGRCSPYEVESKLGVGAYNKALHRGKESLKKEIQDRVRFVTKRLKPLTNKNTKIILTTGLEDNYDDKAYLQILSWIQEEKPTYLIARSPVTPKCGLIGSANYCELHPAKSQFNNNTSACIFNNDGNLNTIDDQLKLFNKFSKCSVLFAWEPLTQGRGKLGDKFTEPRNRYFPFPAKLVNDYRGLIHEYQKQKLR